MLASRLRIMRSARSKTPASPARPKIKSIAETIVMSTMRTESPRPSTSKGIYSAPESVAGKIGHQVHPQSEPHLQSPFLSLKGSDTSFKPELLSINENIELKDKHSLSVISSDNICGSTANQEKVLSKVDDPNLWCRNSTEECFTTCVTVDFFIATLKSAWIVAVLILYFKTSLMSPSTGSVLDYIIEKDRNGTNTSTFAVCENIYKMEYGQKKNLLLAFLVMGFPMLPLELYLTKLIFYGIETRSKTKCLIWIACRVFLTMMFMSQALFKTICFTFEDFDIATVPEIIYRVFEIHVAKVFLEDVKKGLPRPIIKRKLSFQPSHQSFVF